MNIRLRTLMTDGHMGTAGRTLQALQDYFASNRAMPSFVALAKLVGVSVSTVADAVGKLKSEGFIRASETGRLQPGERFFERMVLGSVQAGQPTPVAEALPEGLLIDEYLVDSPTRTMLLTVKGESMRDAGLLPGDMVVVKRGALPNPGDIVVAMLGGDFTVKELAKDAQGVPFLRARNPDFADIVLADDCEVVGVVVGQFRRYARRTTFAPKSFATAKKVETSTVGKGELDTLTSVKLRAVKPFQTREAAPKVDVSDTEPAP
jgi:repressor LexA